MKGLFTSIGGLAEKALKEAHMFAKDIMEVIHWRD